MSELENALRNALAKGEAEDPAFRRRVYRAAADALDRNLKAKQTDPERVSDQKRRLAEAIRTTEASFASAAQAAGASARGREEPRLDEPRVPAPEADLDDLRAEPRLDTLRENGPARPGAELRDVPAAERRGRDEQRSVTRRAPFALILSAAVVLGLVVIGGWWVVSTGALQSAEERDNSVPNPPLALQDENFEADGGRETSAAPRTLGEGASQEEGWISLFDPTDPTTLSLRGDASASVDSDAFGNYVRLTAPDPESGLEIDMPPGAFETLAGGPVQFSLVARTEGEQPIEISVSCDFGPLGDCGRRRFTVTQSESEFLFRVDLENGGSAGGAHLLVAADTGAEDQAVKLSAVRVRRFTE